LTPQLAPPAAMVSRDTPGWETGIGRRSRRRWEFIAEDHAQFLGRKFVHRRAAAVAVPAEVHGHDVEACGGEARREVVPHFALAVTLVEQQDAWTGFPAEK